MEVEAPSVVDFHRKHSESSFDCSADVLIPAADNFDLLKTKPACAD